MTAGYRTSRVRLAAVVGVVSAMAGVWLGWMAGEFIAQDRCLDAGGSWNATTRFCDLAARD